MLACVSGTIFGRDVVPDVSSSSATSPGLTGSSDGALPWSPVSVKRPASASSAVDSSMTRTPRESADTARRRVDSSLRDQRARPQISEISVQFLDPIGWVQRGACRARRHGENRHRHLRTIRQHHCHPVTTAYPHGPQRAPHLCRCADKDGRRSAERGPERESPARREYAWPDVPAGEEGTKMERRASGSVECSARMFLKPLGITA